MYIEMDYSNSRYYYRPALLICAALALLNLLLPAAAVAETVQCYRGEYVVKRPAATRKLNNTLDALQAVSAEPLEIEERSTQSAALVLESAIARADRRTRSAADNVEEFGQQHLCKRLERRERKKRRELIESGRSGFIRRIRCDCNSLLKVSGTPNDQHFHYQWGLNQAPQGGVDVDMNAPEAWDITTGSSSTIVAVIDTGIDYNHEDLRDNMWVNPDEIAGNGIDDDGNGYVDDVHGINAIAGAAQPGNPMDDKGHGTHVAGTIGAVGNNSTGVVGVAWDVQLVAVKFLDSSGSGSLYDAIVAIDYVTDLKTQKGINITLSNNSWGGGGYFISLRQAIQRARQADIIFVAAAGNNGRNIDSSPQYPAAYSEDNIVSVAAIDQQGNLASFSNYGVSNVDIAAPGVSIASTYPGGLYYYMKGTSMAAPHVSGALALLKSFKPELETQQLIDLLYSSSKELTSLSGVVKTEATVDLLALLQSAAGGSPPPAPPESGPGVSIAGFGPRGEIPRSSVKPFFSWTDIDWEHYSLTIEDSDTETAVWQYNSNHIWRSVHGLGIALDVSRRYRWKVTAFRGAGADLESVSSEWVLFWYEDEAEPTPTPEPTQPPLTPGIFDLRGQVVDGDSNPLVGVRVEFATEAGTTVQYTGPDGRFDFEDIDGPVEYTLFASRPGIVLDPFSGLLSRDEDVSLIAALKTFTISGTVMYANQAPMIDVLIDAGELGTVRTGSTGDFQIEGVPYGTHYTLRPRALNHHFYTPELHGKVYGDVSRLIVGGLD